MPRQPGEVISPAEVMEAVIAAQGRSADLVDSISELLLAEFDGTNLEVDYSEDHLPVRTVNYIASLFRKKGWGVTVNIDEKKWVFWIPKSTKAKLNQNG